MMHKRFIVTHSENTASFTRSNVLVDTMTGVNYLFIQSSDNICVTPLLDGSGKPITEGYAENSEWFGEQK